MSILPFAAGFCVGVIVCVIGFAMFCEAIADGFDKGVNE